MAWRIAPVWREIPAICGLQVLAAALLLPIPGQAACSRPLRVEQALWPPYLVYSPEGRHRGLDYEILRAMLDEAGCSMEWVQPLPRRRRLRALRAGELDLIPAASARPQAQGDPWLTHSYRQEVLGLYALRDATGDASASLPERLKSFDDLARARLKLLMLNTASLGPEFERARQQLHTAGLLEPFDNHTTGFEMLLHHRAPLILGDAGTLTALAQAHGVSLLAMPFGFSRSPVSFLLNRYSLSEADLRTLDLALARLEARGVLREIRQRYGLE